MSVFVCEFGCARVCGRETNLCFLVCVCACVSMCDHKFRVGTKHSHKCRDALKTPTYNTLELCEYATIGIKRMATHRHTHTHTCACVYVCVVRVKWQA